MEEKAQENKDIQPEVKVEDEGLIKLKASLKEKLGIAYQEFIKLLRTIPCQPAIAMEALKHLDTGYLWFKESIDSLQPQPLPAEPVAPQEASPEPVKETA